MDIEDISETSKDSFLKYMLARKYESSKEFTKNYSKGNLMFKANLSKTELFNQYQQQKIRNESFEKYCVIKSSRSHSGVCVISTIMAPEFFFNNKKQKFTCKYDCFFCPNDPEQARSYPRTEPVPLRGSQNDFDVVRQAHSRMAVQEINHHTVDKLEWLVLGGTWSSFPKKYREEYHCSIFFSANLWSEGVNVCKIHKENKLEKEEWRKYVRKMKSIKEEMEINRKGNCRVIGVTVETRPDEINLEELRFMRNLGITRIQMGFQHTDNKVLKKVNRGCSIETCMKGLKLALNNGFKVDGHWMPDLPGSDPEMDMTMLREAFTNPNLVCDQVKIYPCQVLEYTKIKEWYDEKKYIPYAETDYHKLLRNVIYAKSIMPPWVRTNRIVRDFPVKSILGGLKKTHLGDIAYKQMEKLKINCMCIRCREVRRQEVDFSQAKLIVRTYISSGSNEYFISMEVGDTPGILLGFCRLRINSKDVKDQFPELNGCALIRELHVYGQTTSKDKKHIQHQGIGKKLLKKAEEIALENDFEKIAVISGIGVQDYYLKRGYEDGFYMIKNLVIREESKGSKKYIILFFLVMMFYFFVNSII